VEVTYWGTRGSIAKAGPTTVRYGGNTSCVAIRSDSGTLVVVDCGTGAHGLGQHLVAEAGEAPINGHILVTHTHWDHIQGLPFFAPLFRSGCSWNIYGPTGLVSSLGEILAGQMEYSYFPVSVDQLSARVRHHDLVEGGFDIGEIHVETQYLNHTTLTLGYRIEVDGATVVYASDHEPHDHDLAHGGDISQNRHDTAHARFVAGADLMIHDAQYQASEYAERVGWGHSTIEYVVDVARAGDVARIALFHHDPTRTDEQVDELVARARQYASATGYRGEVDAAREGTRLELRTDDGSRRAAVGAPRSLVAAVPAVTASPRAVVVFARTPELASVLSDVARAEQLEVFVTSDLRDAFDAVCQLEPGIVLVEALNEDGGFDIVAAIRGLDPPYGLDVPLIMVGSSSARWRPDALETGITEWVVWPASSFYLRTKLRAWLLRRTSRWRAAPLPADEPTRLAALHALGVLDTAPEERFDRYTEEISTLLDVPVALVTFVDRDRQWFKSRHGIDTVETPREMSLCAHAILGADVLEVPDALADPRFADNPMVVGGPRLRFYAGMPLTLSSGSRVGTLCVADRRPRRLDARELSELRRVAALVVDELER
jgi:phosphoribosyl 1,2-cyclic phosphodiesterase/DNA-binding response OmpR family regulator